MRRASDPLPLWLALTIVGAVSAAAFWLVFWLLGVSLA